MGKRTVLETEPKAPQDARHVKRQRVHNSADPPTEVTSVQQLQQALASPPPSIRNGLSLLKLFLDSILYHTEEHDLPPKRTILSEFLDAQKREGRESKGTTFLPTIFQAWEYAVETSSETLQAQLLAIFALLLKVLSSHVDFLGHGTLLCKVILQSPVIRGLNRILAAGPQRETSVQPALRLLTALTKFNEGAHAKAVYAKREYTLEPRVLAKNLGLWKDSMDDPEGAQRKPSIRTNATRYLLAHLRYQDEVAKIEILSNLNIARTVFNHLDVDPPFLVSEILDVMRNHVFEDKTIPRHVKSRILNGRALRSIASLYRYQPAEGSMVDGQRLPSEIAHDFLVRACTSPAYGVMLPSHGFYPPHIEDEEGELAAENALEHTSEFLLESLEHIQGTIRTRNVILGEFTHSLKPHADTLQQELVLAIFQACPELVAHYFLESEPFQYDPKFTSTWIGYSSFLFQTIALPIPSHLGGRRTYRPHPPVASTVLQSILPQPLTQQVLTKCLNSDSCLISLFAVRILIVAFHKLRTLLREFSIASQSRPSQLWEQTAKRLITEFSQRCPSVKAVIVSFQRRASQNDMVREATARLIRLYHEVTPQLALQEKFDASVALCNALAHAEEPTANPEDRAFRVMELEHWIQIARHSPAMGWWQKNKLLKHSPFVALLDLVVRSTEGELFTGVKSLLAAILRDYDMLQTTTNPDSLDVVIASLGGSSSSPEVLEFIDDCCTRFVKRPIKYLDDVDTIATLNPLGNDSEPKHFSPLLMTFVEQWPFKGGKAEKGNPAESLAQWLSKLLYLLKLVGEDEALLSLVRDKLVAAADGAYQDVLKDSFLWKMGKEKAKEALKLATGVDLSASDRSSISPIPTEQPKNQTRQHDVVDLERPPEEDEKHAGLNRWRKADIEDSVDNGDIGELFLCLCSNHTEIRLQAVSNIRQLMAKIDASNDSDFIHLKLLLGEVLETSKHIIDAKPLPYVGGVFAARAVQVLADPLHFMFGKINEFLLKRPNWTVENLPRYYGRKILNSEPEQDDSYHKEVGWYLDYLIDALRTNEDMEIFRTRNVFERLLTYYVSASCAMPAREKIIRLLLRAAAVGGSTTLITRCGLITWIHVRLENNDYRHKSLRTLASRLWETCDQQKVQEWSSGKAEERLAALAESGDSRP